MSEYLDVIAWKKTATGKNFAVKLGSAKKMDNGNIVVYFDALPIPSENGSVSVTIAPQRDKASGAALDRQAHSGQSRGNSSDTPF